MAGLVGGDSDSSALTQESGDEGTTGTGRHGSVATGTDGGTDYAEEEDIEMHEPSSGWSRFQKKKLALLTGSCSSFCITKNY
jgi:MRG-binding protein